MSLREPKTAKHERVYRYLYSLITAPGSKPGDRLPSESALVERFAASRPTVARALRDLSTKGFIERRVGSGSYIKQVSGDHRVGMIFGLLFPGLNRTEIFEPICSQIARSLHASQHALLWSQSGDAQTGPTPEEVERLCDELVKRSVAGVFFAPLELSAEKDRVNSKILSKLQAANIPVVLLDSDLVTEPNRSSYDLVGIDNRLAGFVLAQHFLGLAAERIDFVSRPLSASTVNLRIAGYQEALRQNGIPPDPEWVHYGDPDDTGFVRRVIENGATAIICANDMTAGELMHSLENIGVAVPGQVRVAGFDDVRYAKLLRIPLTTIHQPCTWIGNAAVSTMLSRIKSPEMPTRKILLDAPLIIRQSCGHQRR